MGRKWRYQLEYRLSDDVLRVHSSVSLKALQQTAELVKEMPGLKEWAIIDSKDGKYPSGEWRTRVLDCSPNYLPF